jgi:hypothetical protein
VAGTLIARSYEENEEGGFFVVRARERPKPADHGVGGPASPGHGCQGVNAGAGMSGGRVLCDVGLTPSTYAAWPPDSSSTQRTLPNQALDCVDHQQGPYRKLDQISVENPVSITGGSGAYPHR